MSSCRVLAPSSTTSPPSISALLALSLANTPAPPSISLALGTDSLQDRSSSLFWPSRAGPRAGPSLLRSASARRRRRGVSPARGPRLVAPLLGPRGPGSDPRLPLLDHRGGGRPRSAPQARGAAAGVLPGPRPVPHRSACRVPWGPARIPGLPPLNYCGDGRLRPATDARGAAAAGPMPGARPAPRLFASRGTGGDVSPSRQAPCWPGADGERSGTSSCLSLPRMCLRCNIPTLGGSLRPATNARGAAAGPRPGARLAPRSLRFPDPAGPARTHGAFRRSPRRSSRSRAGRAVATPSMLACDHRKGGTCAPPPVTSARGGGTGGDVLPFPAGAVLARH